MFDRGQICQEIVYKGLVIRGSFIVGSFEKGSNTPISMDRFTKIRYIY